MCDGFDNCGDGSDENNMTLCAARIKPCNRETEYQCANKKCIEKSKVCDFADDCGDSSDELGCHRNSICTVENRGGCEQMCMNITDTKSNQKGYICTCTAGFIISSKNKKKCEDVDECATGTHRCSQVCTNLNGTYGCTCRDGFSLSDSLSGVCKANDPDATLLFANG